MNHTPKPPRGKVYLVGAGPGAPGLITQRGRQCLGQADLVLHDGLVSPELLEYAPPSAEVVPVCRHGKSGPRPRASADQVAAVLAEAARDGRIAVYLKSGDPHVFGRAGRELEALRAAGVSYETVPGVTAASAVAACAEIPLTHAAHASAVALLTGHQPREAHTPPLDYAALARFPGTLVFYMGSESAAEWSRALIEAGRPAETPVAVVRRCSWPEQRTYLGTLESLAELIRRHRIEPPTLIVVGPAAAFAPERPWFVRPPLFGIRVLVTRPREQAGPVARHLAELGADVLRQPAIRIEPPADWSRVDAALGRLHTYDCLVFSSVNGVRYLLNRLRQTGGDMRRLGTVRLAAIGPATAEELRRYHLQADLVPPEYRAEALADRLAGGAAGRRFLLARAGRGREVLAERLREAGGVVDQVVVYHSTDVAEPDPRVAAELAAGRIDWITVTSSAIARALVAMFGEGLRRARLASISPVTSGILRELGYPPAVEAREYTTDGLLAAIRSVPAAWSS